MRIECRGLKVDETALEDRKWATRVNISLPRAVGSGEITLSFETMHATVLVESLLKTCRIYYSGQVSENGAADDYGQRRERGHSQMSPSLHEMVKAVNVIEKRTEHHNYDAPGTVCAFPWPPSPLPFLLLLLPSLALVFSLGRST